MPSKLVIFPLFFICVMAIFSMLGLGTAIDGDLSGHLDLSDYDSGYWYDKNGHAVCDENYTICGEAGTLEFDGRFGQEKRLWNNGTGIGGAFGWERYVVTKTGTSAVAGASFDMGGSIGVIALLVVIVGLSAIVGFKILGSGISEWSVSAILKGGMLISVWTIFSAISMKLIVGVPFFGAILYFLLTVAYAIGVLGSFGGPSGGAD